MARLWYGTGPSDVVVQQVTDADAVGGKVYAPRAGAHDVMTTRTGSTAHTDLLDAAGGAITTVTPAADGTVLFQGVDGYTGSYWLRDQAAPSARRYRLDPDNTLARVIALESAGGTAVTAATFDAAGDLLVGTGSDTYAKLSKGSALQQLRVNAAGTALEYATIAAPATPALDDLTDVSATAPADESVLQYDTADSLWHSRDPSTILLSPGADGRLDPSDYPLGFIGQQTINAGGSLASWTYPGSLVWVRTVAVAALAVDSVGTGNNGSTPGASQTATNSLAYALGDYAVVCVTMSAEATFPTSVTCTGPTNIGAMTQAAGVTQGSTCSSYIFYGRATGVVATSQTFTVTASGGTASRDDWAIRVIRLQGIVSSSALDLSATGGAANSAAPSVGPAGPTVQASEVAIACFGYNPLTTSTFTPTGGWNQMGTPVESTDASPRALAVVYKILTSSASQTATATFVNPAVYSSAMASFKAA